MHVETQPNGSGFTLAVSGEVDVATCPELREAGERAAQDAGPDGLRIDLSQVSFIDSSGVGTLIAIRNAAESASIPVIFANPSTKVQNVLKLTRLIDVFTVDYDA